MRRHALSGVLIAIVALTAFARPAGAAEGLGLVEARTPKFPERAYVLTLP